MAEDEFRGACLVKDNVGDARDFAMTGYGDDGDGQRVLEDGVDGDEAFDRAVEEEARVFLKQVRLAAVAGREVEVAFFEEYVFHAFEDLGGVTVAEGGDEDADGKGLAFAQGAGEEAGAVVELFGGFSDAFAGFLGNGANAGGIVEDERDGGRGEIEVFAEGAQADGLAGLAAQLVARSFALCHSHFVASSGRFRLDSIWQDGQR